MLRIYIADDSISYRSQIEKQLAKEPQFEVVGSSRIGESTFSQIESSKPDLLILDLGAEADSGFGLLAEIHKQNLSFSIIGMSRLPSLRMKAFGLGCRELVDKDMQGDENRSGDALRVATLVAGLIARGFDKSKVKASSIDPIDHVDRPRMRLDSFEPRAVVIASSTGGPAVLESLFQRLSPELKIPIFITQHMPETFTKDLATRLSRVSGLDVQEAVAGETVQTHRVYVAPGNYHMRLVNNGKKVSIALDQEEKLHSVRPAADFLFKTAASIYRQDCMGFVLTGMGMDGAEGAQYIRDHGGKIMIQNKDSSAVWGMPGAAHALGAFDSIGSIETIAEVLFKMTIDKGRLR